MQIDERFLTVFEHDEKSVRFRRSALTAKNAVATFVWLFLLLLLFVVWWMFSCRYFMAESPLEVVMITPWNIVLASPLVFFAWLIVWSFAACETGELDEDGFRYEFRVLVPLRQFTVPLEDVLGFEAMPPELSCELDPKCQTLSVRTADGCIVVFQELLSHWLMREKREPTSKFMRPENAESEISTLANAANRVLAALKPADLPEIPPEPQPAYTRWKLDPHEEGSFFCRPGDFRAGRISRYFLLAVVSAYGTGLAVASWLRNSSSRIDDETIISGILAAVMAAVTLIILAMILRLLCQPFFRPCFGMDRDALRHGHRVLGFFFGRRIPRDAYTGMTISEHPVPPPATLWQCWRKRMPPHFTLAFQGADDNTVAQTPRLTRSEARWMRDEISRNG